MDDARWLAALGAELRRHGFTPDSARQAVDEAATHLRDSGEPAVRAFGAPAAYASALAESAGVTARPAAPARGPVRLRASGISKRYGRRRVLRGVDFAVHGGEVAAVVGANGCGKSTFLRICAGLLSPDSGEVWVDGAIGYCPQDGGTFDFLTADEHFVLVGAGRGLPRPRSLRDGRAWAGRLEWRPDTSGARHLSGGTRQKLNLVLSALGEPDVLLLDEPYQGFDRGTYLDFWDQVWAWRHAGKAVVVVTHLLNQVDHVDTVLDLTPAREGAPSR